MLEEADRRDIYKTLWDRVEQIYAALCQARPDEAGFSELVADLNEFIIRHGAHVDDSDYQLVNDYVAAVKIVHVVCSRGFEPRIPVGQSIRVTPDVARRIQELGEAQQQVNDLRKELRTKVQLIIGGVA